MNREPFHSEKLISIGFLQEFSQHFHYTPSEIRDMNMNTDFQSGTFDADFFAKMLLGANVSSWKHFAKMKTSTSEDLALLSDFSECVKDYFIDPTYSTEAFLFHTKNTPHIAEYIVQKFPKHEIFRKKFAERLREIFSH